MAARPGFPRAPPSVARTAWPGRGARGGGEAWRPLAFASARRSASLFARPARRGDLRPCGRPTATTLRGERPDVQRRAVEDLAQRARELLGPARVRRVAADEAGVVAREYRRLLSEQLGRGPRRAVGEGRRGLLAHADDDPRRRRRQRPGVGAIAADGPRAVGQERVVAGAV